MIYRCGCCLLSATAKYKVAWCCVHDFYECHSCWKHGHPWATEDTWGMSCEEAIDADSDQGNDHPSGPE